MKFKSLALLAGLAICCLATQSQAFELCKLGRRLGLGWSDGYNARNCCHAYGSGWSTPYAPVAPPVVIHEAPIHQFHVQPQHAIPMQHAPVMQGQPAPADPAGGWFGGPQPAPALPSNQARPVNLDQTPAGDYQHAWRMHLAR